MPRPDASSVLVAGPWTHRTVTANGCRFHVAEAGSGPLVLLLHGFTEFWWSWHHQIPALAEAGLHAVAVDLRGYGASDKPPRGYDLPTLAADIAGLVRALGEREAVVVGHDWGGLVAWTLGAMFPEVVRRLVVLGIAHYRDFWGAAFRDVHQARASAYILSFQRPRLPERLLVADDGAYVANLARSWAAPGWPDDETDRRLREAITIPGVAHSALEYYRWAVRSRLRPDGLRYFAATARPVSAPTLQLHGALDGCVLPKTAERSARHVVGPYVWRLVDGAGHFLHEERPDVVTPEIVRWASAG